MLASTLRQARRSRRHTARRFKHLQAYLDEMAFRYNNRENAYLFRDTLLSLIAADRVEYAELIAG